MPQESNSNGSMFFSPGKNLRGLKGLIYNSSSDDAVYAEEIINDRELAQRKAGEAAARRYQAAAWLREMDQGASEVLPKEPTEQEFCLALRNGLILCNVLNKVNPGAVHKVVENRVIDVQFTEGAAQSAIQYFENTRNFLVAVGEMKLLTFEASDLEKGGSSGKVVDCILCLKGYYEWKQAGGIGVWRYGGNVKIVSFPKGSTSSFVSSESADESLDDSESSQFEQLLEYLHLSSEVSLEETNAANALTSLFEHFGLALLQAYLSEISGVEDLPLNSMVIDILLRKVVKDFSSMLIAKSNQVGLILKKILNDDGIPRSKSEVLEMILKYLGQRSSLASSNLSKFCICGRKREDIAQTNVSPVGNVEVLDVQQRQLEELKSFSRETKKEFQLFQKVHVEELKRLEHHIKGLEVAASSYHKVLEENRMLYNQVQDLKGTIRVYCRVRPFLPGQSDGQSTVDYIGDNGDIMIVNPHKQGKDARRIFTFNKVFGTNATQQQIYMDTQPLVRSVLDGYNVCIFAYGQTGSGKTYTMSGPDLTAEETWGVNYRALRDLFHISKERMEFIEYEVGVQMIEIYNEQVRDLLVIDGTNRRLDVRNNSQLNGLNVPDACLILVKCTQDVLDLMRIGQQNRAVGATALNERSSRSHSILTVHVRGKELVSGSTLKGCLHLVDLAGSERVDKSEAVGERLKEAQHINRSLSALGDVISSLAQKTSHIPYRNSKLTQVLQDSLGGHAKTLMFVHINPMVNAIGETVSTLKFAERVASIDLGAARSNKESGEIREFKDEITNLKLTLEKKDAELQQLRSGASIRGAISPLRMPKSNVTASMKPENNQRSTIDDTRSSEVRSCSSGKQRRSRFPAKFTDKDIVPKIPFLAEERSVGFNKARSPSPPVRRSVSTDRSAVIRSRIKPETLDNPPVMRLPFPARVPTNKSMVAVPSIVPSTDSYTRSYPASQEPPVKQDNISETLHSLQRIVSRKVNVEHDDQEQFKQALNVRQGGIRKTKPESKVKSKHQNITKNQKSDIGVTLLTNVDNGRMMEEAQKSEFLEIDNEHGDERVGSPVYGNTMRLKKLQRNFSRNSQNVEPRELIQPTESVYAGKHENKISNSTIQNLKEASNSSTSEFRRSRSTPRGKFFVVP
ncbi:kinesin-like protein KIN-14F [Coffea eugenioides]|uniref:kinesin-like protein KIN-14F n=3 Tax=Coffea eugenioides TaxID=49369 RepID=UPI000F607147|nr:kinesin-like protein KIN-14F [Coffea eugenioides]XP_027172966.1 kinesin-like protein KIN-14F [Coffea eugenioides]